MSTIFNDTKFTKMQCIHSQLELFLFAAIFNNEKSKQITHNHILQRRQHIVDNITTIDHNRIQHSGKIKYIDRIPE